MLNTVRLRLTLWYVMIFGSLLLMFSVFVYLGVAKNLYDQFDHSLMHSGEIMASAFLNEMDEDQGDARHSSSEAIREILIPDVYTAFFEGGQLVASNFPENQEAFLPADLSLALNARRPAFTSLGGFGKAGARLFAIPVDWHDREYLVTVAQPLDDTVAHLQSVRRIFYFGLPAALLIAGCGGFLLAKKSLEPVMAMANQARRIGASNLHERLRVANAKDELAQLAATFNELLSRLNHSFEAIRTFMADASHELRTPIAIIRGEAE